MAKCAECGFLALRNTDDRSLVEVEELIRQTGSGRMPPARYPYEPRPLCFARASHLKDGLPTSFEVTKPEMLAAITREHNCKDFTVWHQGFTPKEHRETLDRHNAQREERKWKLIELIVMGGIVTVVSVIAQIVAAYIQAPK